MADQDLVLALRIRADLQQGADQVEELSDSIQAAGDHASQAGRELSGLGETADQQAARIKAMVAASLQQREALDALAESSDRMNTATRAATSGWQESARAQSASMNAYHNAERAREQQVAAEQRAAEAAAKATAEFDRQQAELGKLLAAIDPVTRELEKLDSLQARLNAARGRGIDPDVFTTYNSKLQEQRDRLLGTSDAMAVAGISAGQYRQAMRQLPMQITDVVTSLASGMPLWMVAIQQGGQIKDSFGGVGATFQALGDQVKSFFGIASNASDGLDDIARGADAAAASANNAKTAMVGLSGAGSAFIVIGAAVAAAGVALALAYEKGSSEADELNKAIVLTGNYAGTTAGQLSAMAASLARANGTQYEAVAVLSEITATGKFTVDQIEQVATTSIAMQEATGKAVSDTVAEFSKLADEPVKASQ
ncbi:TPA: phage tail length tape measure family protein, partial [Pseudomonas aeruginosa]